MTANNTVNNTVNNTFNITVNTVDNTMHTVHNKVHNSVHLVDPAHSARSAYNAEATLGAQYAQRGHCPRSGKFAIISAKKEQCTISLNFSK